MPIHLLTFCIATTLFSFPDEDGELIFGVYEDMFYARNNPGIEGAQWTGLLTNIAITMLENGSVDAVVCVQSDPADPYKPRPFVARNREDVMKARGVKPSLSSNLEALATVEALGVKRLLFIGVGCQVRLNGRETLRYRHGICICINFLCSVSRYCGRECFDFSHSQVQVCVYVYVRSIHVF